MTSKLLRLLEKAEEDIGSIRQGVSSEKFENGVFHYFMALETFERNEAEMRGPHDEYLLEYRKGLIDLREEHQVDYIFGFEK